MIKNEREYRITLAQANKFEQALSQLGASEATAGLHPLIQKAQRDALLSQLDELREQITEYEALKSGQQAVISLNSLEELPRALIQARIAAGLTQRQLAERMRLKEQQIQRYEATEYASADLTRVNEVAKALGLRVREDIFLSSSPHSSDEQLTRLRELVQQTVAAYLKKAV
ncbi:MAG TPA: helix-turn-helix transcriptional regulator [Thermoanaerobaculia bacterium]|jgi:transcriptional regulator with XRE-family HTH domain|nr:helix-turn-helix transcriptional regulator [Thermoanaerobaculia bacterium]